MPEFEWNGLTEVLGLDLLSRLLGISATSVRRYKAAARTTPDDVADRLHFLSLIVGDLSGACNEIGVRQWFERKRAQLGGRTPLDHLKAPWKPGQPGPRLVQDLARALTAHPPHDRLPARRPALPFPLGERRPATRPPAWPRRRSGTILRGHTGRSLGGVLAPLRHPKSTISSTCAAPSAPSRRRMACPPARHTWLRLC